MDQLTALTQLVVLVSKDTKGLEGIIMLAFVIRLDDATPTMNKHGWMMVETLLDKYEIKPIVGIIPDSKDPLFRWEEDSTFWTDTVLRWQAKNWTIAQHGCHHLYHDCSDGAHSEFVGLSYERQMELIQLGNRELRCHNVIPTCFFAPAHTFDDITIDVCRDSGLFQFISDGHAVYPFVDRNMLFLPNIFDTAHKILPFGVYTFVIHPSFINECGLARLESFIKRNQEYFLPIPEILAESNLDRKMCIVEKGIAPAIKFFRILRKVRRGTNYER